jgi:hypothetical protein
MLHLPSGFGVPQWPLSFDHLGSMSILIVVAVVLLSAALVLLARRQIRATRHGGRRARRRRPLRLIAPRPSRRHLRPIV